MQQQAPFTRDSRDSHSSRHGGSYGDDRRGGNRFQPYNRDRPRRYDDRDERSRDFKDFASKPSQDVSADGEKYFRQDETVDALFKTQNNTGINFNKYDEIPVSAKGEDVPAPIALFTDAKFDPSLAKNIARAKYEKPTPIQKYSVPIVLKGRDLMACAQTGSGKTAAFLFPIIQRILDKGNTGSSDQYQQVVYPKALILAPTRELATQIYDEARKFTYQTPLRSVTVYGGTDTRRQIYELKRGCDILVATPGRLCDLMNKGVLKMDKVDFLVLDEADRMLDMGFEPQIRMIVQASGMPAPGARQTLMFSATFPKEIQTLAREFLSKYVFITVGRVGSTTESISQKMMHVSREQKTEELLKILGQVKDKTLVFTKTKRGADDLERYLSSKGHAAIAIHGDKSQQGREHALYKFKSGKVSVLVATDVAARGLDINNVAMVVNYDLPENIDDYVHRIGRTGRAGKTGIAIAFYNDDNVGIAKELINVLSEAKQEVPDWLIESSKNARFAKKSFNRSRRPFDKFGGGYSKFGDGGFSKRSNYYNNSAPSSYGSSSGYPAQQPLGNYGTYNYAPYASQSYTAPTSNPYAAYASTTTTSAQPATNGFRNFSDSGNTKY